MSDAAAQSSTEGESQPTPAVEPATGGTADAPIPASPPSPDEPTIEDFVNDAELDPTEFGLPDKTVAEIRKIRKDVAKYRDVASTWTDATEGWSTEDIENLQTALSVARTDPTEIGKWMYEQGKALMGDTAPLEQEPAPEPEGPLTKDDIAQMIREGLQAHSKQTDEERRIQEQIGRVKAETETLGFGPSHPLHGALLLTAKSNEVSLAEAAELLKQGGGVASSESNTQDAPDESGRTPVPPEGVTPAGTQRVVDPKKAAIERLGRTLPEGQRGFADV